MQTRTAWLQTINPKLKSLFVISDGAIELVKDADLSPLQTWYNDEKELFPDKKGRPNWIKYQTYLVEFAKNLPATSSQKVLRALKYPVGFKRPTLPEHSRYHKLLDDATPLTWLKTTRPVLAFHDHGIGLLGWRVLCECVGAGSTSGHHVYVAIDVGGAYFALKETNMKIGSESKAAPEKELGGKLAHPNVCRFFGQVTADV